MAVSLFKKKPVIKNWLWACEQMKAGKSVSRIRDSGTVHFTYDKSIRKIMAIIFWDSTDERGNDHAGTEWGISMEDIEATDFF